VKKIILAATALFIVSFAAGYTAMEVLTEWTV